MLQAGLRMARVIINDKLAEYIFVYLLMSGGYYGQRSKSQQNA